MPHDEDALGGRAPLIQPNELTAQQRPLYDAMVQNALPWAQAAGFEAQLSDGRLIGPFNVSLYSPGIGAAFAKLQSVEGERTTLSERVRQVVILTVGAVWQCDYELYAHRAVAHKAGLSAESIDSVSTGAEVVGLRDDEALACEFTRQLARDHHVTDKVFRKAETLFGLDGIADLLFLAGCYFTVCGLLNSFEVPVPSTDNHL